MGPVSGSRCTGGWRMLPGTDGERGRGTGCARLRASQGWPVSGSQSSGSNHGRIIVEERCPRQRRRLQEVMLHSDTVKHVRAEHFALGVIVHGLVHGHPALPHAVAQMNGREAMAAPAQAVGLDPGCVLPIALLEPRAIPPARRCTGFVALIPPALRALLARSRHGRRFRLWRLVLASRALPGPPGSRRLPFQAVRVLLSRLWRSRGGLLAFLELRTNVPVPAGLSHGLLFHGLGRRRLCLGLRWWWRRRLPSAPPLRRARLPGPGAPRRRNPSPATGTPIRHGEHGATARASTGWSKRWLRKMA